MLAKKLGGEEAARRWWTDVAARVAAAPDAEEAVRQLESAIARDVDPYAFGTFLENPADHHLVLKHRFAHGPLRTSRSRSTRSRGWWGSCSATACPSSSTT